MSASLLRVLAASLLVGVPAAVAGCSDDPSPKTPPRPAATAPVSTSGPQVGMRDTPSSARKGDETPVAPRPALASGASGVYQQALQAFANGDLATAKADFEKATQADPRSHQAFYSLGVVQERLKDPGAAASYRQAFTLVPDYEPAIIAYAMLLAKKSQISEADRFLTEKRGQMPKSAAVAATLAEVKSLQKDTGSAQRLAQEALKINPDYRPAMVIIARDHYRNRRLDLALYALQAILDGFDPVAENPPRDKDNGEALLLRGLIWKEQGNRFGAMDMFKKAVAKRPDLVEARIQLGSALLAAGSADEALPILEGSVRYDADNLAGHLNLGDAYRLLQKYGDAKREFDWVLAHNASLPQVHYDLGLLYLYAPSIPGMNAKTQIGEAIKAFTKFRELRSREEKDDSEELLNSAKIKEGEINAASAPVAPAPPPPAAGSAAPAAGSAAPAAGSAAPAAGKPAAPPKK
jgi:tetratricopeptide (TPR) repeat protein